MALVLALVIALMTMAACAAPATPSSTPAPVVVRETVIIAGTPQIVERTRVVEQVVTATPPPPPIPDAFVFGAEGEPICLDPALITDPISARVTNQIFEGLVKFDKDTTSVVPALAEKWTTSEDGKTWIFTLRKGVKFHDGTDFNADAVVKNFDYWKNTQNKLHDAQVKAKQSFEYYEAQFGGLDNDSIITQVEAVNATTVKFSLYAPQGPFLNNLAMFAFGLWSPNALEKAGTQSCQNPVGTGPYKFVEWRPNRQVTLTAFADYWDKTNAPKMKNVVIRDIPNPSARLLALAAGEIHGMEGLEPRDIAAVKDNGKFKLMLRPSNTTGYIAFNFKVKEFNDPRVRQAFAQAINKDAIVKAFYGSTGAVAKEFQPAALWGYNNDLQDWKYDTAVAKKLLADAGFPNGISQVTFDGKPVPLDFWYLPISRPYYPSPKEIAGAIAADWAKAGIVVNPQTVAWTTYLDKRKNGQMPLYMLGWPGDNGDPDNFLCYSFCLDPKGSPKVSEGWFQDKELSELLLKAQASTNQADRAKLYRQAEQIIHDRALRLFIASDQTPLAFTANVSGYVANPTGTEYFNTVVVKQGDSQ